MARTPSIRRILREHLGPKVPEWIDGVLRPLNTFMEQVADAMASNLSVSENLAQCWVDVDATGINSRSAEPIPVVALPALRGRVPYGVSVERMQLREAAADPAFDWYASVHWEPATVTDRNGEGLPGLRILAVYGLNAGTRATLTLLVKAR